MNIKYISYYDTPEGKTEVALSAVNKMNYIIDVLRRINMNVDIISASICNSEIKTTGEYRKIRDGVMLKTFDSFPGGNIFKRFIRRLKIKRQLKSYLNKNIKNGDIVFIYHSLNYIFLYRWLLKKKHAKVVLEVEELYTDVAKSRFATRQKELKYLSYATAYMFPTSLLNNVVNVDNKPSIIIHGTYQSEESCGQPFNDGKVHVVYAGTFDPRKGGVQAAAAAARFLTNGYHVHILGFGSAGDTKNLLRTIDDISKKTECIITYDGLKSGEEYIRFIQSCDIGLSTQNPEAAFNATSFPSKILSYMANGLRVVSIRIPVIEQSAVGDYMYYYDKQTPEEIAKAIMQVDLNDGYDSRQIIKHLDEKLLNVINILIGEL